MDENQASADNETKSVAASAEVAPQNTEPARDLMSRIDAASSHDELAKLQAEFFAEEGKKKPEAKEEQSDESDEQGQEPAESETSEDSNQAEGEQDGQDTDGQAESSNSEAEGEVENSASEDGDDASEKGTQFRVRRKDPVEKRALELIKRNPDLTLKESLARAELEILGDNAGKENQEPVVDDGLPKSLMDAEVKLKELRAAKSKAMREELDLAKADELDLEMEKVREHMRILERRAIEDSTRAETMYLQEFNASSKIASSRYDFLNDDKSEGFFRAREIDEQMKADGDPTYHDPNKPLIIAQMVARELRIAPKSKSSVAPRPKAPVKGSSPAGSASKPGSVISSGGSRTVNQSTQIGQQLAKIDAAQTMDDLRALGVAVD